MELYVSSLGRCVSFCLRCPLTCCSSDSGEPRPCQQHSCAQLIGSCLACLAAAGLEVSYPGLDGRTRVICAYLRSRSGSQMQMDRELRLQTLDFEHWPSQQAYFRAWLKYTVKLAPPGISAAYCHVLYWYYKMKEQHVSSQRGITNNERRITNNRQELTTNGWTNFCAFPFANAVRFVRATSAEGGGEECGWSGGWC